MGNKKLYLAYGSNINLAQMKMRCPDSKVIGKALLADYGLEFWEVATILPHKGAKVPVLVWEISAMDEAALDRYEGYPHLYRKELFDVEVNGATVKCMAYVMNDGIISAPSTRYANIIKDGYEQNGMDLQYLRAAIINSVLGNSLDEYDEIEVRCDQADDHGMRIE